MKMLLVFYFKNLPGCLLTPRPATTVPRALLQRHVSPLAAPPELRRCVAAVPGRLSRGTATATGHCYRSRDLAPEARRRRPSPSWGLPRCAVASPSRRRRARAIALCAVLRLTSPPSLSTAAVSVRTLVPSLRRRVVAAWPSPSRGVLPSISARATAVVRGTWRRKRTRRSRRAAAVPFAGSSRGVPSRRRHARAIALCAVPRLSSPPSLLTAAISDRTLVPPLRRRAASSRRGGGVVERRGRQRGRGHRHCRGSIGCVLAQFLKLSRNVGNFGPIIYRFFTH